MSNFADTLINGINNPDCAFFVGTFMGQYTIVQMLIVLILSYLTVRYVEDLAVKPSIKWIKNKIWGEK